MRTATRYVPVCRSDSTTVDVDDASYTNSIGDNELKAVWTDPDFNPAHHAVYYIRVIEIPTPRWTAYDAVKFNLTLPDEVPLKTQERAYTSVATVLKIMEQKGFLSSERADRSLIYRPAIPKAEYQKTSLKNLSSKLFNDTPAALVARLVDDEEVTDDMLVEMRALLNERLGDNGN